MTNEEAKEFLDNLKICISEHPIVADWLVEIADRKTEPTISKMEQVDEPQYDAEEVAKDINRRVDLIKREWEVRHTETNVETMSCAECKHRPIGAEICEEPCHYEPKDEPQTECPFDDAIPCEWVNCPNSTDCPWK